jgi:hypothetical protein
MNAKYFLYFIISLIVISITGCVTSMKTVIVPDNVKLIKLKWGELNSKTGEIKGWQIDSNLVLYQIQKRNFKDSVVKQKQFEVSGKLFINFVKIIQDSLLAIQILNEPSEKSRFIEFINEKNNVHWRGIWNIEHETYGSGGFRAIYDSLQTSLKLAKQK